MGKSGYFYLKGYAVGFLIQQAWAETKSTGEFTRAWHWSDTYPVGKLVIPSIGLSQIVLEDSTPGSLAFGPAHILGTSSPGDDGNIAIAGHRDSYFRNLCKINVGDEIQLETQTDDIAYTVVSCNIAQPEEISWLDSAGENRITLITCYPFNFVGNAPMRYVVVGVEIISTDSK